MRRRAGVIALCLGAQGLLACGGGRPAGPAPLVVVVSAPLTGSPWVGQETVRGARLAVDEVNAAGGVMVGTTRRRVELLALDHAGSPGRAVDNARTAVDRHALVLVTDGEAAAAVAAVTGPAAVPVLVTFDGGSSVIDAAARPSVFRIAPRNATMARRLVDYLAQRAPKPAVLVEGTQYGRDGQAALRAALTRDRIPAAFDGVVASGADAAATVLQARQSGADTLLLWGSGQFLAAVVSAARSTGWTAPIYTSPTGEDPVLRAATAAHPDWVEGLTFVSFRITAEVGPAPYLAFRGAYEKAFGAEQVGVVADGTPVVAPPDWAMFPYDAVKLVADALRRAGATGAPVLAALDTGAITGANGDEYGFSEGNREGVSESDTYFGRFHHQRFTAVTDDILGPSLPPVAQ